MDDYLKIPFSGNLQKYSKIDSINLNKEQVEKLINRLTELKNNLPNSQLHVYTYLENHLKAELNWLKSLKKGEVLTEVE